MTPSQIIALVRDGVIVLAAVLVMWLVYRGGQDRVRSADLKALQQQIASQGRTLDRWRTEAEDANQKLNQAVVAINAAPAVVHDWVRTPTCVPERVLPPPAGSTGAEGSNAARVQPERRGDAAADRRDGIVAEFKARWGTELATCQSILDQWPN